MGTDHKGADYGITYADASLLFKSADLPSSVRHVRTMIWTTRDAKGRLVCPVQDHGYHSKRVLTRDVEKLIKFIIRHGLNRAVNKVYAGLPPTDTAVARLAVITKGGAS